MIDNKPEPLFKIGSTTHENIPIESKIGPSICALEHKKMNFESSEEMFQFDQNQDRAPLP